MNILIVSSSANGEASVSNKLAARFVDSVREADPAARVVLRDVGANPLPHLDQRHGRRDQGRADDRRPSSRRGRCPTR